LSPESVIIAGADVVKLTEGRVAAPQRPGACDPAGVGEQGTSAGVLQEPGRPSRLRGKSRPEIPGDQLQARRPRTRGRRERKTGATGIPPSEGDEARRDGRRGVGAPHTTVDAGEPTRGTPPREHSEANCLTSGCKSRRRRSPCGAVVISGSSRGDPRTGSPDVKAPGGQVDSEPLRSGQHRGRATRRAAAKANGRIAEMGPRMKLIQAEHRRCQGCLPSTRWPVPTRTDGARPASDLPADVEGGNPGEPSSESSEGLVSRQEDP
jgi:hypothetical protein